ncbi:hypothetical protein [Aquimarina agarivorans]|uniref:hypothetical protein n=1 Tax=Aquimarina agarivorans TaxID=980584 RepID=UPI000248EACF|nr:hypothetical protein [Aquimarina agarivorans]
MRSLFVNNTIIFLLLFLGCRSPHHEKIDPSRFIIKIQKKQEIGVSEYAEIIYKPIIMDTLKLKKTDYREVSLSYNIADKQTSIEELEQIPMNYTYLSLKNKDSIIPFRVKVDKIGDFFIEGYVKDSIVLNDSNGEQARIIVDKIKVCEKIKIIPK